MTDFKRCSKCGEVKVLEAFHRSKTGTLGVHAYCKVCAAAYSAARHPDVYRANRERVIRRATEWQEANPQRYRERLRKWQEENRPALLEAKRRDTKYRVDSLSVGYVAGCIGAPASALPPSLIELKREQLSLRRLTRQLEQELEKRHGD